MPDASTRGGGERSGEGDEGGNRKGRSISTDNDDSAVPSPSSFTIQEKLQRLRVILSRQGGSLQGGGDKVAEQGDGDSGRAGDGGAGERDGVGDNLEAAI